jgi:hypothetical protein
MLFCKLILKYIILSISGSPGLDADPGLAFTEDAQARDERLMIREGLDCSYPTLASVASLVHNFYIFEVQLDKT